MAEYEQQAEQATTAADGANAQASVSAGVSGPAATGQSAELNAATLSPDDHEPGHDHGADGSEPAAEVVGEGGTGDDPPTKAAAIRRHNRNRKRIKSIIDAGLKQEMDEALGPNSRKNLWRNTAQWLDAGNAKVVVLSPIHDPGPRAAISNGQTGFFDTRVDYKSNAATYSDDVTNNTGLEISETNILGTMSTDGGTMTIVDPQKQSEALLIETLIHEVQHDADQHQTGKAFEAQPPTGATAPAWAYNGYQTEFRAYWLENPEGAQADSWPAASDPVGSQITVTANKPGPDGTFGTADDVLIGTVTTALTNARQEAILNHLISPNRANGDWYANNDWTQSYAYVAYYMCSDAKFAQMVNSYDKPASGNALNSIRIQALSDAVAAKAFDPIKKAADELDGADVAFLKDRAGSKPFWDQVARDLTGIAYAAHSLYINGVVNLGAAPAPIADGGSYTVVAGDTLGKIAARTLGDANRYPEITALNRGLIKDKNVIHPGWTLRLPKP
jgi:hypothetical protein